MDMSATEFSLIINLNSAFGMSVGIFNGPLLRNFGYRKVAAMAGFIFSFGLFLTSFASSFTHFVITYSIIACKLLYAWYTVTQSLYINLFCMQCND